MKSKRFEPIWDIVANSAQDLRQLMADAERRVAEIETHLAQLQAFREDYLNKAAHAGGLMDTVRLQNNRAFLERLAEAVRVQLQKLGTARAEYEARRKQWSEKRIEAEVLGQAVERFRQDERQVADRRDQQEVDETGLRVWLAARGSGDRG
ncbi:MAG: flagellar export protein FliJ [Steroidobacterales bacterium]